MTVAFKPAKLNPENGPKDQSAGTIPSGAFRLERFLRFFSESASGKRSSVLTLQPFDHLRELAHLRNTARELRGGGKRLKATLKAVWKARPPSNFRGSRKGQSRMAGIRRYIPTLPSRRADILKGWTTSPHKRLSIVCCLPPARRLGSEKTDTGSFDTSLP